MRIVFMGTPEFALPSLTLLLDQSYDVAAVVTAPDRPQGRGQKLASSPIKSLALQRNLPILQPISLKDPVFLSGLRNLNPDLIVVVAFRVLPSEVFRLPTFGSCNLHASLLPRYRGAAPINWALINGDTETGVTTFFLQEKVDTGSVLLQARIKIGPDETAGELHDRLSEIGAEIILQTVRLIESGRAKGHPQDEARVTAAPKIFKETCRLDWAKPATAIHNLIRGLSPSPAAWTMYGDRLIKIYKSQLKDNAYVKVGPPGTIVEVNSDHLIVVTGEGLLSVLELQQEGKRRMEVSEFLRGTVMVRGSAFA